MTSMVIETEQLEVVLKDVTGLLTILHKEEDLGLEQTSIRIEINALEALVKKVYRLSQETYK